MSAEPKAIIDLGVIVRPWGKVAAVGILNGERYYWFTDEGGNVSMIDADTAESRRADG
jgi:hypothetical protein